MPIISALRRLIAPGRSTDSISNDEDLSAMPADAKAKTNVRVVVGLGNPGGRYADTRHNLGFFVIDELAKRVSAPESRRRFKAEVSEARRASERFILVKPQTYMNASWARRSCRGSGSALAGGQTPRSHTCCRVSRHLNAKTWHGSSAWPPTWWRSGTIEASSRR